MTEVLEQIETARVGCWRWAHWSAAGVLLFAAFMKWEQLPVIDRMGTGLLYDPRFGAAQVVLESALAIWLLSGLLPLWSRRAAIAAFSLFILVTSYKALTGEASCGCFGQLQVNPWLTLALDLTILVALACKGLDHPLRWRHADTEQRPALQQRLRVSVPSWLASPHWRLGFAMAGLALVVSLTLWRMPAMAALPAPGGITFSSGLAILEPEKWPGQPLPILDYLEGDKSALASGVWSVIIYSNDCDHCRQFVPQAVAQATSSGAQYAFVELPPFARPGAELIAVSSGLKLLRLSDKHEWFAQTPILMQMQNGLVTSVKQGNEVVLTKEVL